MEQSQPLRVAIVGKAPGSLPLVPADDPNFEIWTLSDLAICKQVKRWDRHFELHDLDLIRKRCGGVYFKWLSEQPPDARPIYTIETAVDVPASVKYPKDEIVERFGTYFTNTVSWMIAYAIHAGAEEIHVYGVDMAQTEEYRQQRPSCEYFLGIAVGMGIKVHIPGESDLLKCRRLYGFDKGGLFRTKFQERNRWLKERVDTIENERDNKALEAAFMRGCLDSQVYYEQWVEAE